MDFDIIVRVFDDEEDAAGWAVDMEDEGDTAMPAVSVKKVKLRYVKDGPRTVDLTDAAKKFVVVVHKA
jgi:hypothetical protein